MFAALLVIIIIIINCAIISLIESRTVLFLYVLIVIAVLSWLFSVFL